ncbi:MAG: transcription elongation factor GreA [Anaerolineae bacterium]
MDQRPIYITKDGYEELEKELEYLKNVRRKQIAERLHNALTEGDLLENAELEDARREQSFVEGRIQTLQRQLSQAIIIEGGSPGGTVTLGSRVTVMEEGSSFPEVYQVVGSAEASPKDGKISNESPLGQALLGKQIGDKAVVKAPDGPIVFEILAVE